MPCGWNNAGKGESTYLYSKQGLSDAGVGAHVVSFAYYMTGKNVGTLSLEAMVGSKWKSVWSKKGAQQKQGGAWKQSGAVRLAAGTTQVRSLVTIEGREDNPL